MFMCCFGPTGTVLVGFLESKKLWRLKSREVDIFNKAITHKRKCPWSRNLVLDHLSMDFRWVPRYPSMYQWEEPCDLREMRGMCYLFQDRGKRIFNEIYVGFIEDLTHLLIRLQRWSKRMMRARRLLAVCMGMHARLGSKCLMGGLLGEDLLALIVKIK